MTFVFISPLTFSIHHLSQKRPKPAITSRPLRTTFCCEQRRPAKMPDFGCYITIYNECSSSLILSSDTVVDGNWSIPPPQIIPNGQNYQFVLEDDLGPEGSEGFVTYNLENTSASVVVHFSCPVWSSNIFTATSNNTVMLNVTQVGPNSGHPLISKVLGQSIALVLSLRSWA